MSDKKAVTNFEHDGRGLQWSQNVKKLRMGNSCNSLKFFFNFQTDPIISKSVGGTPSILYSFSTKSRA